MVAAVVTRVRRARGRRARPEEVGIPSSVVRATDARRVTAARPLSSREREGCAVAIPVVARTLARIELISANAASSGSASLSSPPPPSASAASSTDSGAAASSAASGAGASAASAADSGAAAPSSAAADSGAAAAASGMTAATTAAMDARSSAGASDDDAFSAEGARSHRLRGDDSDTVEARPKPPTTAGDSSRHDATATAVRQGEDVVRGIVKLRAVLSRDRDEAMNGNQVSDATCLRSLPSLDVTFLFLISSSK